MTTQQTLLHHRRKLNAIIANTVTDLGLVKGHCNYQKFIILGAARTGSTLLVNLLQSHPSIKTYREIFMNESSKIDWGYPVYSSTKLLQIRQENPLFFIDQVVFGEVPKNVSAVGFKIFYDHAQGDKQQLVWNHLKDLKSLKIIHITRRNLLKNYLSLSLAFKTDIWVNNSHHTHKQSHPTAITLNYDDCIKFFEQRKAYEKYYDNLFSSHQKMNIIYEAFTKNLSPYTKQIQEFLEVKEYELYCSIKKQAKKPLSKAISNYFELKEKFIGTPWIDFFEE